MGTHLPWLGWGVVTATCSGKALQSGLFSPSHGGVSASPGASFHPATRAARCKGIPGMQGWGEKGPGHQGSKRR